MNLLDLDELYRLLRGSHVQAQGIVDTIHDPLLVLSADLTVISANPAFYRTFETHRDVTIGVPLYELGNGQWDIAELRTLLEQVIPRTAAVFDYEVRAEFPHVGQRTMLVTAQRLKHPDNGQRVLLLTIVDSTLQRQAADEQDILIGELDHRIKNLMAMTHAIARQTGVEGRTAEEYRDSFLQRLEALGRSLEVSANGAATELPALVQAVMEPHLAGTITIAAGPRVSLHSAQAASLGMILHELATNAVKHGALSAVAGEVGIDWTLTPQADGGAQVELRWTERNGPAVTAPARTGFGTRLIRFAAERELGGQAELDYAPGGLIAKLRFLQR